MAQSFVDDSGVLILPGAYPKITVQSNNSGLATTGVLMLIGESDVGPAHTEENDLEENAFGPDQLADVIDKYGSGPLVDAFRAACSPSSDLSGSFSRAVLVKTNPSTKASGALLKADTTSYGTLYAKKEGKAGNLITYGVVAATAEVAPSTGAFTWIPAVGTVNAEVRLNGEAALSISLSANQTPAQVQSAFDLLAGIDATGGDDRVILTVSGTLALDANPGGAGALVIDLTRSVAWATSPSVGDTLVIPASSVVRGAAEANVGAYVITSVTSTTIRASKLSNAGKATAAQNISYIGETGGPFQVGEVITGGTSGATATVTVLGDYGTFGTLGFATVTNGPFVTGETLTGGTSLATGTASGGQFAGASPGTVTNAVDVSAQSILAVTDSKAYAPIVIKVTAGNVVDGVGKSLELAELTTGTDLLSRCAYDLSTTAVDWVSTSADPQVIVSSAEYKAQLNAARTSDGSSESLIAGGQVALKLCAKGVTTCTFAVDRDAGTWVLNATGGSAADLSGKLTDYPTISDFVVFLSSQTDYVAEVGTAALGQLPMTALDSGTFNVASKWGSLNGRIKVDAYKFLLKVAESALVQLGDPAAAALAGLPAVKATSFLSGAVKGATTANAVSAAIDALEAVQGNFVVPLFSRDATLDIADGLTDAASTYEIDAINLACKAHVLKMSTLKKKRNRQAFLSLEDTFENQKEAASNLASSRCSMTFEDFKQLGGDGTITQYQPWMGAVLAAAMQAAGFYRAIFNKDITTAGIVHAAGDYNPKNDSNVEDALLAGLLPARKSLTGGFIFDSDQTTYTKDSNFVFNSIQAMYAADTIALSTAQRMQGAFVGQSTADISAAIGLSFLEGIMADFLRLKLISPSDDALKGFRNAAVRLNGGNMVVSVEIKLAGAIYFVPIQFLVSPVSQSA